MLRTFGVWFPVLGLVHSYIPSQQRLSPTRDRGAPTLAHRGITSLVIGHMATAFAADDHESGTDPGPTAHVRKLAFSDHPGKDALPHQARPWIRAAEAELGELLSVAEGGRSMAVEELGIIYDIPSIPRPLAGDAAGNAIYMREVTHLKAKRMTRWC